MINEMSYEELNLALMFSGLELYNKPPKAAYEGITYSYKDRVDPTLYGKYYKDIKCTNDKKITLKTKDFFIYILPFYLFYLI